MDKKRAYNRFRYSSRVSCAVMGKPPYSPQEVAIQSEIVDISDGGMRIRTVEVNVGDIILVRIPLPELSVHLPVLTEVQWTRQSLPGTYDAGLRFLI